MIVITGVRLNPLLGGVGVGKKLIINDKCLIFINK